MDNEILALEYFTNEIHFARLAGLNLYGRKKRCGLGGDHPINIGVLAFQSTQHSSYTGLMLTRAQDQDQDQEQRSATGQLQDQAQKVRDQVR